MINDAPLPLFEQLSHGLLKPRYDYSFGNIPNTIEHLLTGTRPGALLPPDCFGGEYPRPEKIVVFFIDSFGWSFWQQHQRRFRTTRRIMQKGVLTPISALFPSTTAASVATMNFGVLPAEHAFYEWNLYVPAYGEVIQSLPFCPLGPPQSDACLAKGYDPHQLFAVRETVHQRLARHGVRSLQFSHRSYATGAVNQIAFAGAEVTGHHTLAQALVQLKQAITATPGKALFHFYWGDIDSIGHEYGPGTSYHEAEITAFWRTFDAIFRNVSSPDTLYLFTADHGQVCGRADETIYLNELIPELPGYLSVSPTGKLIYPNGGPRDQFLHVKHEYRDAALDLLHRHLDGEAAIMTMDAALEMGLFGPQPVAAETRRRLGDILVLPRAGRFIFWREKGLLENRFHGHHGGLAPEELITVLGVTDTL